MITNFDIFLILESILHVDPDFLELVRSISDKDDVARELMKLINNDIKTNFNYIKPSSSNDEISFVNNSHVQKMIDLSIDPFTKSANSTKIGRSVRQILDSNGVTFADRELESFVNNYKAAWDKKYKKDSIFLVSGEEIRKRYLYTGYVNGGGSLNNSCMKHSECQIFLDIYVNNPEVCQLAVYVDSDDRVLARALVWKLDDHGTKNCQYYLDRIYTRFDYDDQKIKDWFSSHFSCGENYYSYAKGTNTPIEVSVKGWKYDHYPYMDSFGYLDIGTSKLIMDQHAVRTKPQVYMRHTNGSMSVPGFVYSNHNKNWIRENDAIKIGDDYYNRSEAVKDYRGSWILKDEAMFSKRYASYVNKSEAIDDPDFGVVSKEDLVNVYDELSENIPTEPKKSLRSIIDRERTYKLVMIGKKEYYININKLVYNISGRQWMVSDDSTISNKGLLKMYSISTSEKNAIPQYVFGTSSYADRSKNLSIINSRHFECYGFVFVTNFKNGGKDTGFRTEMPIYHILPDGTGVNRSFINENTLKFLSLDPLGRKIILIQMNTLYEEYRNQLFELSLERINEFPMESKSFKIKDITDVNIYLSKSSSSYIMNNKLYDLPKSGIDPISYMNEEVLKIFKEKRILEILRSEESIEAMYRCLRDHSLSVYYCENKEGIFDTTNFKSFSTRAPADILKSNLREYIKNSEYYIMMYFYYWYILGPSNEILNKFIRSEWGSCIKWFNVSHFCSNLYRALSSIMESQNNKEFLRKCLLSRGGDPSTGRYNKSLDDNAFRNPFDEFYNMLKQ